MSGPSMNWRRAKVGKPTQYANTRFPNDQLGRSAKAAWAAWKATLTPSQRRRLASAPR
jgi:hypothetical protein